MKTSPVHPRKIVDIDPVNIYPGSVIHLARHRARLINSDPITGKHTRNITCIVYGLDIGIIGDAFFQVQPIKCMCCCIPDSSPVHNIGVAGAGAQTGQIVSNLPAGGIRSGPGNDKRCAVLLVIKVLVCCTFVDKAHHRIRRINSDPVRSGERHVLCPICSLDRHKI